MVQKVRSFMYRHFGPTSENISDMLLELGYQDLDECIYSILPENIRKCGPLNLEKSFFETPLLIHRSKVNERLFCRRTNNHFEMIS